MGKFSRLTVQDAYYDGLYDPRYEMFCEETQTIFKRVDDGWDTYESVFKRNYKYEDEWELKMLRGEIKRKL
ncbi:hypothetical protein ACFQZE_07275 [Paenibacillus sp. GCM10027627]|uniref:hypothetical protein n=1 Tax=unclassified Paenibacillus TaxID=185978 RepID=UPI00363F8041